MCGDLKHEGISETYCSKMKKMLLLSVMKLITMTPNIWGGRQHFNVPFVFLNFIMFRIFPPTYTILILIFGQVWLTFLTLCFFKKKIGQGHTSFFFFFLKEKPGHQKGKNNRTVVKWLSLGLCIDSECVKRGLFVEPLPQHTNLLDQVCQNIDWK